MLLQIPIVISSISMSNFQFNLLFHTFLKDVFIFVMHVDAFPAYIFL